MEGDFRELYSNEMGSYSRFGDCYQSVVYGGKHQSVLHRNMVKTAEAVEKIAFV